MEMPKDPKDMFGERNPAFSFVSLESLATSERIAMEEGLREIAKFDIPGFSEYAKKTIEICGQLRDNFDKSKGKTSITVAGRDFVFEACGYDGDQIEYFLSDDMLIHGGEDFLEIARQIANYDAALKSHDASKIQLQTFYEEKIMPIEDKDRKDLTDDEQHLLSRFSDWHKSVYGHRPNPGRNECQNKLMESLEKEDEERDL
jgi:hypothetical protein